MIAMHNRFQSIEDQRGHKNKEEISDFFPLSHVDLLVYVHNHVFGFLHHDRFMKTMAMRGHLSIQEIQVLIAAEKHAEANLKGRSFCLFNWCSCTCLSQRELRTWKLCRKRDISKGCRESKTCITKLFFFNFVWYLQITTCMDQLSDIIRWMHWSYLWTSLQVREFVSLIAYNYLIWTDWFLNSFFCLLCCPCFFPLMFIVQFNFTS